MIDVFRRWSGAICMLLLAWLTQAAAEGEPVSLADDGGSEEHVDILPIQIPDDEDPIVAGTRPLREPFLLAPSPSVPGEDPPPDGAYVAPEKPPTSVPFELRLVSVVDFGRGLGTANISGHTVQVGQDIPRLDPDSPPRLLAVEGPAVLVEHRGILHLLDMRGTRAIFIGPFPLDAEGGKQSDGAESATTPDEPGAGSDGDAAEQEPADEAPDAEPDPPS